MWRRKAVRTLTPPGALVLTGAAILVDCTMLMNNFSPDGIVQKKQKKHQRWGLKFTSFGGLWTVLWDDEGFDYKAWFGPHEFFPSRHLLWTFLHVKFMKNYNSKVCGTWSSDSSWVMYLAGNYIRSQMGRVELCQSLTARSQHDAEGH